MKDTYELTVCGAERSLPLIPIDENSAYASFVVIGDTELVERAAKELAGQIQPVDVVMTAEAKGIALAYEISRLLHMKEFIVARKSVKSYMRNPISASVHSITTQGEQHIYLDETDIQKVAGKRVCIVDDVISTGESLRAVEEREGGYGNVGEAGGIVYFNDEYGNVYAVDTATGTRELFEIADGFLLSPDGSRMLQIVYEDGENGSLATMYLCDLASGTRMQIAAQAALSDYAWSEDSRVLFYLVSNRDAEDAADYPVRLMRYSTVDGRTTDLGALASNSIFPGRTQDSILLMYYQDRDGLFYPITYQLSLTDLTDHAQDELVPTLE